MSVCLSVCHTWPGGALLSAPTRSHPLSICRVAGALGPWDSSVSKRDKALAQEEPTSQ